MTLNNYRDEAGDFLEALGAEEEDIPKILDMLDEKLAGFKKSINDRTKLSHQTYDVMFLLFELAARFDLDLDAEWAKGQNKKQKKYLGGIQ